MTYIPLRPLLLDVVGIYESMNAMREPKGSISDTVKNPILDHLGSSDAELAKRLIRAGDDHAKAMRGVLAYIKLKDFQVGFMIEFETYRLGTECLSTSSSMHQELKHLTGEELANQKQKDLPEKTYTRHLVMSYQTLRRIYKARRLHRHPDWKIFCRFIEELPYFSQLINP